MKNEFYNRDYFDFDALKIDEKYINVDAVNCTYAYDTCLEAVKKPKCIGLIKESGYGINSGIADFVRKTRYKHYYSSCGVGDSMKLKLIKFLHLDLPEIIPFNDAKIESLVDALTYLFTKTKRQRIIILCDVQNLDAKALSPFAKIVENLKGHIGIVTTINQFGYDRLIKWSEKNSAIRSLLTNMKWESIPPPKPQELANYCMARGVLADKLIKSIIKKATDFRLVNKEIDTVKESLKKRGYLDEPD